MADAGGVARRVSREDPHLVSAQGEVLHRQGPDGPGAPDDRNPHR